MYQENIQKMYRFYGFHTWGGAKWANCYGGNQLLCLMPIYDIWYTHVTS